MGFLADEPRVGTAALLKEMARRIDEVNTGKKYNHTEVRTSIEKHCRQSAALRARIYSPNARDIPEAIETIRAQKFTVFSESLPITRIVTQSSADLKIKGVSSVLC